MTSQLKFITVRHVGSRSLNCLDVDDHRKTVAIVEAKVFPRNLLIKFCMYRARMHFKFAEDLRDEAGRHIEADNPESASVYLARAQDEIKTHRRWVRCAYTLAKD